MGKANIKSTIIYAEKGNKRELITQSLISYVESKLVCRKN